MVIDHHPFSKKHSKITFSFCRLRQRLTIVWDGRYLINGNISNPWNITLGNPLDYITVRILKN